MSQSHNELSTNAPFLEAGLQCVYNGCIAMARRTQLLAVFCKYSRTLWVLRWESWSSISKIILYIDIYCILSRPKAVCSSGRYMTYLSYIYDIWLSNECNTSKYPGIPWYNPSLFRIQFWYFSKRPVSLVDVQMLTPTILHVWRTAVSEWRQCDTMWSGLLYELGK